MDRRGGKMLFGCMGRDLLRLCWGFVVPLAAAHGGGGPETTLLVVNADSPASLQVANTWIGLRDLPERHVLWLKGLPAGDTISVEDFRRSVLAPIGAHLEKTGLTREIDLVAYSAGFPYAVDFSADEKAHGLGRDKLRGEGGSLTGMSFFAGKVEAGRIDYLSPYANHYARRPVGASPTLLTSRAGRGRDEVVAPVEHLQLEPARGFRSRYLWGRGPGADGMDETDRYRLAVMLGYTGLRGNSVPEIERYLARGAASDGTRPAGTVYLMQNRDIRSRTRQHLFESTIGALRARGLQAEVLPGGQRGQSGREPRGKTDVIGLVAGTKDFDWAGSKSAFLPGAIAESLTSYGGHFGHFPQTKLSEFLRHGAAGSSGAVREPYALVEKFPLPQMHVHYAEGVSLAEAFFLSVLSPYQLLVVGEPLARPFAHFAQIVLPGWPDDAVRGALRLQPQVRAAQGRPIERLELWVDGLPVASAAVGEVLSLDTRKLADGAHEVRVVAVEAGAIETRSYVRRDLWVDNAGRRVSVDPPGVAVWGDALGLKGEAPGARSVRIEHLGRVVGEAAIRDGRWHAALATAQLGLGEVSLRAVAVWADSSEARSATLPVRVGLPPLLRASAAVGAVAGVTGTERSARVTGKGRGDPGEGGAEAGLAVRVEHMAQPAVEARVSGLWKPLPRELGAGKAARLVFDGAFLVKADGLYELDVEAGGAVSLRVGGQQFEPVAIAPGPRASTTARFALPLAAGWHRLELAVANPKSATVRATLAGPEVAFVLEGERVRRTPGF